VINVAPAGTVMVGGWVQKPGSYPVTRNLTLAGAVTSAGGHSFPADLTQTTIRRVLGPGEERVFTVDLDAVAEGREADVPVLDGDVVTLPADGVKLVPWGVWAFVSSLVRFGWSVAVI